MSKKEKEIYLSKKGETHGPFTTSEFEAMQKNGEIHDFTLIWNEASDSWSPLDIAPPPPRPSKPKSPENNSPKSPALESSSGPSAAPISKPSPSSPSSRPEKRVPQGNWSHLQVLCHDLAHVVSGVLESVTETGCLLVSDSDEECQPLATQTTVVLNLLDLAKNNNMNVRATLSDVFRRDGKWVYQISWNAAPAMAA